MLLVELAEHLPAAFFEALLELAVVESRRFVASKQRHHRFEQPARAGEVIFAGTTIVVAHRPPLRRACTRATSDSSSARASVSNSLTASR